MLIKQARKKAFGLNAPLKHDDHGRPKTRREFISQGFMTGTATVFGSSIFSLFGKPGSALADLSYDAGTLNGCGITGGANKIPFICFDLAGGANLAGSNVLVGGAGGQTDFLSTAGYSKLGLPGDMTPFAPNPNSATNDFVNTDLGLAFHSESAMLEGILDKAAAGTQMNTNGAVIPARSENDTGNNPHNPTYGIYRAGADGELLSLIGSRSSESGGNSMAPADLIDLSARPTKVDRPSDATGLVDLGGLTNLLSTNDTVAVMESVQRISNAKMGRVNNNVDLNDFVNCGYIKSAYLANEFSQPEDLDPVADPDIVGPAGIFSSAEFNSDGEFRKTASVMKLVMEGRAGAGTITMGGYDYHTGERGTGEMRDLRAGRCIGAVLEYAARLGKPVMIYVFSDGSVASNGRIDDSEAGRGKGEWTGDNQSTASAFYLVYNPTGRPTAVRNQIGHMRSDASVETSSTPAANNVNLLVQTVLLNYMALHGEEANFGSVFPNHGLGNATLQDSLMGFGKLDSVGNDGKLIVT